MNLNKAREYYSAYYEGSLERGLREGFERALREEAQVQAEYRAFEATMRQLDSMKSVEVATPDDLHERIMARIDRHAWDKKQSLRPGVFAWWKAAVLVGAGALVIALSTMQNGKQPDINTAGSGLMPNQARLEVRASQGGVLLDYPPVPNRTLTIKDADGKVLETIQLRNQRMAGKPLTNQSANAKIVTVEIEGKPMHIAIPGIDRGQKSLGQGSFRELALDIANATGVPVVLNLKDADELLTWTVDPNDAHETAAKALANSERKVELRGSGNESMILWISDN